MLSKLALLLAVAVLAIAGCGGDDKKSSPTPAATGGSGAKIGSPSEEQIKAAVASCKQSIDSQPQLKDSLETELQEICEKAASGGVDDARKASAEVCVKIIEDLVPAGAPRDQALVACEQAGEAP